MLDWWREASDLFAPLSKLAALSKNEALQIAVFSAGNRIHAEISVGTMRSGTLSSRT